MKVVYQSETLSPVLASLSRTAELATRLKLTGEKMASENWQVVSSEKAPKAGFLGDELWDGRDDPSAHRCEGDNEALAGRRLLWGPEDSHLHGLPKLCPRWENCVHCQRSESTPCGRRRHLLVQHKVGRGFRLAGPPHRLPGGGREQVDRQQVGEVEEPDLGGTLPEGRPPLSAILKPPSLALPRPHPLRLMSG